MSDLRLVELADACNDGACNVQGLIRALGKANEELASQSIREHPALPIILGHLSYLIGESLGPSSEAMEKYDAWKAQNEEARDAAT